jgi:hypothetical protein
LFIIYFYYYLLIVPHSAKIPYYSLAVFITRVIENSYTKSKEYFRIQNLSGGGTKIFGGPHGTRGPLVEYPYFRVPPPS